MKFFAALPAVAAFAVLSPCAGAQTTGRDAFLSACSACHQSTGQGVKGAFPALAGSAVAQGDPMALSSLVLNGSGGMPRFAGDLTDAQIAAILTYVRSAWGNAASPITAAQIAAVRARLTPAAPPPLQAH